MASITASSRACGSLSSTFGAQASLGTRAAGFCPASVQLRAGVPCFVKHHIGTRASGVDPGKKIGSRRRKGGVAPPQRTEPVVESRRGEPLLESYMRRYREEGHLALDDGETLLAKASNPYGLVLSIAEEANEYLRNNKEESLLRKPILKVISDRINEVYGEGLRDCYLNENDDYSEFEQ